MKTTSILMILLTVFSIYSSKDYCCSLTKDGTTEYKFFKNINSCGENEFTDSSGITTMWFKISISCDNDDPSDCKSV